MKYLLHITGTLVTKFLGAISTLLISVLIANDMGKVALGEISLVVLTISISIIISGIIGGPSLIYFTPRKKISHLIIPAYAGHMVISVLVCVLMGMLHLYNPQYMWLAILICIGQALNGTHLFILLGLGRITAYNMLTLMQQLLLLASLYTGIVLCNHKTIEMFLWIQSAVFALSTIVTAFFIKRKTTPTEQSTLKQTLKEVVSYGFTMQLATFFQQLNYRLSYYVIEIELGLASLGVFALAMQISEGVLLINKSIATVLYSRAVNETNAQALTHKTLGTLKFSYITTFAALLLLVCIPTCFFEWIFSKDFSEMKKIFWYIVPGIWLLSILNILSSYFSSVKMVKINTVGSFAGLVVLALIIYPLIYTLDLRGAAVSNTLSYLITTLIALVWFTKKENIKWKMLLPGKQDIGLINQLLSTRKNV